MKLYEQMTIIGVGLLGASLAKACRHLGLVGKIVGFGRNKANLKQAEELSVIDSGAKDLQSAVKDADLIVICVPVGSMVSLTKEIIPWVKKGCHITDVGSVKGPLTQALEEIVQGPACFIGSHPLAGGEKSGLSASDKELFKGARCIITPTPRSDPSALKKITRLWEGVGMSVHTMDAAEHDAALGAISHLPHVVAYALINAVAGLQTGGNEDHLAFSAGALTDTTRIASSDPVMWRDICVHNRQQVLRCIDHFQDTLSKIRGYIENEEGGLLKESFETANEHRLKLTG